MTLADEDTNSILTDNAKRAIQGNEAMQVIQTNASGAIWWPNLQSMQVVPSGGYICNQCKWCHLVAKFAFIVSGAIWWPYLQLMQVTPSGGQICNYCKWRYLVAIFATNASGAIWWPNLQLL